MKIKRFYKYFENHTNKLIYYLLDWDDNILHMPTVIHMDHLVGDEWIPKDISTDEFAIVRNDKTNWRLGNNDPDFAFSDFRDINNPNIFIEDAIKAIENENFAPSWNTFINCLVNGKLFAIVTSRGHEPDSIRKAIEWIIDNYLSEDQKYEMYQNCLKFIYLFSHRTNKEYKRLPEKNEFSKSELISDYLDNCGYYGIQSQYVESLFGKYTTPEKGKELCIQDFVKRIHNYGKEIGTNMSIGFSDDDIKFSSHMEKFFKNELSLKYIMDYYIIDTSKKGLRKSKIEPSIKESAINSGTPGKEGSILPFTKWGNITTRLYPSNQIGRQNDNQHDYIVDLNQNLDLYTIQGKGFKRKKK